MPGSKLNDQRSKLSAFMRMMLIVVGVVAVLLPTPSAAASSLGMIPESPRYGPVTAQAETPTRTVSRDPATGEWGYKHVLRVFPGHTKKVCRVTLATTPQAKPRQQGRTERHTVGEASAGDDEGSDPPLPGQQEILCTPGHDFYRVNGSAWLDAQDLKPGDVVLGSDGKPQHVVKIEVWDEDAPTWNFKVEDFHTYFVAGREGVAGVWVHNTGCPPKIVKHPSKRAARRAAEREAGMGKHGGRTQLPDQSSRPGSRSPQGDPGVRTEVKSVDTRDVVHHDPYGHKAGNIPPHYGVNPKGGKTTTHHTYPSAHNPQTNR